MQGGYGGGVYPAPPIPPDYTPLYGGGSTPSAYGGSAPSAPSYAAAAPHLAPPYQNQTSSFQNSSLGAYGSDFPNSFTPPSNAYGSADVNNQSSYSSSYQSYAPAYPSVADSFDRSLEFAGGSAPSSTSFDSFTSAQGTNYGSRLPGSQSASAGYESYDQLGQVSYPQSVGGATAQFDMYGNYGVADSSRSSGGSGHDRSYGGGGLPDAYAYDGGGVEPYGARGTGGSSWSGGSLDNYGSYSFANDRPVSKPSSIARASVKPDVSSESGGIQKFRVKLLPELRTSESIKDVVCQIGLDGVRMVDPSSMRTLRIYPLDTITKWEVKEPSVFTFWAKSPVDIDQRMIQLQSSSYLTTQILDTLTAACVQRCEMVKDEPADTGASSGASGSDPSAAKKSSVLDWVALRPRAAAQEEKQHWVPDEAVTKCTSCDTDFGAFLRRHHCRNCGDIFCDKCTRGRIALNADEDSQPVRVCDRCLAEVTQRLENPKPVASKPVPLRTHEDLAKKLQEELERNSLGRKSSFKSGSSGSSQATSVTNCSKCGSVTLVTGSNTKCSNCDTSFRSSVPDRRTSGSSASSALHGPPHLWPSGTPASDGPKMREVACPTCTVHLQVQVPAFGTETVECGVCQHPFLVAA